MKKKLLAVVLSTVLCFGMTVTAFAAPSPVVTDKTAVAEVNGQKVEFETTPGIGTNLSATQNSIVSELQTKVNTAENPKEVYMDLIKTTTTAQISNIDTFGVVDIAKPEGVDISSGVPITFAAPGVRAGDQILLLHLKSDGIWETVSARAGDGTITGTFTTLSPVWYFKVTLTPNYTTTTTASNNTNNAATTTATSTSPKTDESNMNVMILVLALVVACGAVVYGKRRMQFDK